MKYLHSLLFTLFLASVAQGQIILVNLGNTTLTDTGWNTLIQDTTYDTFVPQTINLIDSTGASTGASMLMTDSFWNHNESGLFSSIEEFIQPAAQGSLFVGSAKPTAQVTFSGLDTNLSYDFKFFAHRSSVTNDRSGLYTLTGANSDSVIINGNGLNLSTNSISGITPNASGVIILDIAMGDTNEAGFAYLNAMSITAVSAVPEPSTYALIVGLSLLGGVWLRRRIRHGRTS